MNEEKKLAVLNKIKEYNRIIIGRHSRPDGDAVGSTNGLAEIIKASFPEKEVFVVNEDYSNYVAFLEDDKTVLADEDYKVGSTQPVDPGR
ncbi:MAG: hypothetical protein MJ124_06830, partial [Lachnospiraceae bacterium]|nr:hypothetical protein [Lachnospiraceae bacterium]